MADKYIVESVVHNHAVKTEVWAHTPKEAQEYVKRIYGDAYSHSFRTTRVPGSGMNGTEEYKWRRDRGMLK